MFELPAEMRRVVYTTNVIESLNFSLRKIIKGRSAFPNDDSVYRLIYLGLEQISRKWTMPIKNWKAALQQFAILMIVCGGTRLLLGVGWRFIGFFPKNFPPTLFRGAKTAKGAHARKKIAVV